MNISEVRIKLMNDPQQRLLGFCSITLDRCFVIRDLKIIRGTKGPFVAMPSRKLTDRCPKCKTKNHLRARFCNQCGTRLGEDRAEKDEEGRAKLYADIAHPINSRCREMIQKRVLKAYEEELEASKKPGYVCRYDEYDYMGDENGDDRFVAEVLPEAEGAAPSQPRAPQETARPPQTTAAPSPPRPTDQPPVFSGHPNDSDESSAEGTAGKEADSAGRAHRVEPAQRSGPAAPHHVSRPVNDPVRGTTHTKAHSESEASSDVGEDDFGAGVD
ncbi:MAG: stage V sporulation protein G [Planctomycetota bacterium]|nr:MAG: stage V sporulation protein G [Planctomycetota bacterium]